MIISMSSDAPLALLRDTKLIPWISGFLVFFFKNFINQLEFDLHMVKTKPERWCIQVVSRRWSQSVIFLTRSELKPFNFYSNMYLYHSVQNWNGFSPTGRLRRRLDNALSSAISIVKKIPISNNHYMDKTVFICRRWRWTSGHPR